MYNKKKSLHVTAVIALILDCIYLLNVCKVLLLLKLVNKLTEIALNVFSKNTQHN